MPASVAVTLGPLRGSLCAAASVGVLAGEAERPEEPCLSSIVRLGSVQQIGLVARVVRQAKSS